MAGSVRVELKRFESNSALRCIKRTRSALSRPCRIQFRCIAGCELRSFGCRSRRAIIELCWRSFADPGNREWPPTMRFCVGDPANSAFKSKSRLQRPHRIKRAVQILNQRLRTAIAPWWVARITTGQAGQRARTPNTMTVATDRPISHRKFSLSRRALSESLFAMSASSCFISVLSACNALSCSALLVFIRSSGLADRSGNSCYIGPLIAYPISKGSVGSGWAAFCAGLPCDR